MTKKMPYKDPGFLIVCWQSLPEPVKAAILYIALSAVTAFRKDDRTAKDKIVDTFSGVLIVLIAGAVCEAFGINGGWVYVLAGALGGLGIKPTSELIKAIIGRRFGV